MELFTPVVSSRRELLPSHFSSLDPVSALSKGGWLVFLTKSTAIDTDDYKAYEPYVYQSFVSAYSTASGWKLIFKVVDDAILNTFPTQTAWGDCHWAMKLQWLRTQLSRGTVL